ncbi:LytTR family DNA-binding domain-containing protein [Fusobacterium ulcerans]|uniref:LytTR family DNA-binding domain-containing protein n=1 Tax=Fusobacterium ulcerans TaxID=861 RepID=UPI001D0A71A1|nr:LytTR family DNA-binding domain-containing protein [Fusobacterium ulcerans]MCB8563430.1 LytTR family transcriptional regulator [Fusobacterium ulcerans]MCB8647697.1 LytTR family transcriptional regulator [Fusobacterium ulcerans]
MTKIAIETDRTLKILLREYFEYEFIETKNYEIDDILKEGISLLIIDDSIENIESRLKILKKYKIKVILLFLEPDIYILRKYIKENLIFDFLKKSDYRLIEEIIDFINVKNSKKEKIYIDTNSVKLLVEPKEILYIGYSKIIRKSVIKIDEKEYLSNKSLSEIQALLFKFSEFIRIERSCIINLARIKEINLKEEILIFDNNEILQLSKKILKRVEMLWLNSNVIIKL